MELGLDPHGNYSIQLSLRYDLSQNFEALKRPGYSATATNDSDVNPLVDLSFSVCIFILSLSVQNIPTKSISETRYIAIQQTQVVANSTAL